MSISCCTRRFRRRAVPSGDTPLDGSQAEFTAAQSGLARASHRMPAMFHEPILWSPHWMDQYSALVGFLMSRLLRKPMSAQENVVLQTTVVATGTMRIAAGFVGILPALGLLDEERDGVPAFYLS